MYIESSLTVSGSMVHNSGLDDVVQAALMLSLKWAEHVARLRANNWARKTTVLTSMRLI